MPEWVCRLQPAAQKGMPGALALFFMLLPTGTAPPLLALALAFACRLFAGNWDKARAMICQRWFWPVIPMVLLPVIGLLGSQNPDLGMDYAMKGKYWAALLITGTLALDDDQVLLLMKALWLGLFSGALLAAVQVSGLMPEITPHHPGFGVVHTLLSMYLIVGILTAAFYFRHARSGRFKLLLAFLILAFVFHLAVLKGRSGYLIFILVSPMVAANLMHGFRLRTKAVTAAALILALFLSPVVRQTVVDTLNTVTANRQKALLGQNIENMPRFYILSQSLQALKKSPLTGIGTGSLTELTRKNGPEVRHPHNNFLYMGVSFGIAGFLSCAWLFWTLFSVSWRQRHTPLGYVVFSTSLVLFFGGMFDTQILNTGTLVLLTVTYGFLHQLTRNARTEQA